MKNFNFEKFNLKLTFVEDDEVGGYTAFMDNIASEGETKVEALCNLLRTIEAVAKYKGDKFFEEQIKKK